MFAILNKKSNADGSWTPHALKFARHVALLERIIVRFFASDVFIAIPPSQCFLLSDVSRASATNRIDFAFYIVRRFE